MAGHRQNTGQRCAFLYLEITRAAKVEGWRDVREHIGCHRATHSIQARGMIPVDQCRPAWWCLYQFARADQEKRLGYILLHFKNVVPQLINELGFFLAILFRPYRHQFFRMRLNRAGLHVDANAIEIEVHGEG